MIDVIWAGIFCVLLLVVVFRIGANLDEGMKEWRKGDEDKD